ncbi:MAG: hypothetical protein WC755_05205 [Candidatus Woesearchaeota archaeon]|jgi:hypothetical protein
MDTVELIKPFNFQDANEILRDERSKVLLQVEIPNHDYFGKLLSTQEEKAIIRLCNNIGWNLTDKIGYVIIAVGSVVKGYRSKENPNIDELCGLRPYGVESFGEICEDDSEFKANLKKERIVISKDEEDIDLRLIVADRNLGKRYSKITNNFENSLHVDGFRVYEQESRCPILSSLNPNIKDKVFKIMYPGSRTIDLIVTHSKQDITASQYIEDERKHKRHFSILLNYL